MIALNGWIPPSERTREQRQITDAFHQRVGHFGVVGNPAPADIPDRQIFAELELKHNGGKLLPRIWQLTGSCVGCGGARAYLTQMLADIIFAGDHETVKPIFPFATYGVGRRKAGMPRTGEGSFGAAQAWACEPGNFGYLAWDDPRVPKPSSQGEWWKWSKSDEINWSHPKAWPVQERELAETAGKHGIETVTRVRNTDQLLQGFAQGYSATLASMYGTKPRVEGDVLLGRWNDQWAHQMSAPPTWWKHPRHGLIFQIDNQWGPHAHGICPTLSQFGVTGSFWILEADMDRVIRTGEVYLHSGTGDFPARPGLWTTQGFGYE